MGIILRFFIILLALIMEQIHGVLSLTGQEGNPANLKDRLNQPLNWAQDSLWSRTRRSPDLHAKATKTVVGP